MSTVCQPKITALVPVKKRSHCKTRLAQHLQPSARLMLVRSMLNHVVHCLRNISAIERVVVVSEERDQLADNVELLADRGDELNSSLDHALQTLRAQGAEQILIVPADLADVQADDIEALIAAASDADIVIAPCNNSEGTNALLFSSSLPLQFQFGESSFNSHCQQAQDKRWHLTVVRRAGLGFDVDTVAALPRCRQLFPSIADGVSQPANSVAGIDGEIRSEVIYAQ